MTVMRTNFTIILFFCGLLGFMSQAQATYIERTITMDGVMTDWYDTEVPPTVPPYNPAGDITNNAGQFSTDAQNGDPADLDQPLSSTGRDLRKFSFTWDATNLYFYVERWASSTNTTDWWFYIDSTTGGVIGTDPDGLMQSGEKLLRVSWQGNTGSTVATLYDYVESASGGDPIVDGGGNGDGYTMPGDKTNAVALYNTNYGASSGTEMETILTWASLGFTGPSNIAFHISSSNGQNIPNNIIDNMDGPAGGQLFPVNLTVTKTATVAAVPITSILGLQYFDYEISVYNGSIDAFTDVDITDNLPSQVTFDGVSYTASSGTYNSGTGIWDIPSIASNATETLTITVQANALPVSMDVDNTATLTASTPADEDNSDDADTATVTILPIPELTIVKYAGGISNADPDTPITYTLTITNGGGDDGEVVEITDQLSPYEKLLIDYSAGQPFLFTPGTSGLTLGTVTYSADYGVDLYGHTLATDPPNIYDDQVTNFKIQLNGTMNHTGASFTIQYQTQVR